MIYKFPVDGNFEDVLKAAFESRDFLMSSCSEFDLSLPEYACLRAMFDAAIPENPEDRKYLITFERNFLNGNDLVLIRLINKDTKRYKFMTMPKKLAGDIQYLDWFLKRLQDLA